MLGVAAAVKAQNKLKAAAIKTDFLEDKKVGMLNNQGKKLNGRIFRKLFISNCFPFMV
jgi:hypothetical protein